MNPTHETLARTVYRQITRTISRVYRWSQYPTDDSLAELRVLWDSDILAIRLVHQVFQEEGVVPRGCASSVTLKTISGDAMFSQAWHEIDYRLSLKTASSADNRRGISNACEHIYTQWSQA